MNERKKCRTAIVANDTCLRSGGDKNLSPVPGTELDKDENTLNNTSTPPDANTLLCAGRAIHFTISETPSEFPPNAKYGSICRSVQAVDSYAKFYMFSNPFFVRVLNLLAKKRLTFKFFNYVITVVNA